MRWSLSRACESRGLTSIDERDDAGPKGLRFNELECRLLPSFEQPLAVAENDRIDEQPKLIDKTFVHQGPHERRAPMHDDIVAGALLELRCGFRRGASKELRAENRLAELVTLGRP
jgi:hypothetical protein